MILVHFLYAQNLKIGKPNNLVFGSKKTERPKEDVILHIMNVTVTLPKLKKNLQQD